MGITINLSCLAASARRISPRTSFPNQSSKRLWLSPNVDLKLGRAVAKEIFRGLNDGVSLGAAESEHLRASRHVRAMIRERAKLVNDRSKSILGLGAKKVAMLGTLQEWLMASTAFIRPDNPTNAAGCLILLFVNRADHWRTIVRSV